MHTRSRSVRAALAAVAVTLSVLLAGCAQAGAASPEEAAAAGFGGLVPQPQEIDPDPGTTLDLGPRFAVTAAAGAETPARVLAEDLARITGAQTSVAPAGDDPAGVALELTGPDDALGPEGYRLEITDRGAVVSAATPGGLHNGGQTVLQLLDPPAAAGGAWTLPGGEVTDRPRYAYRGAMLDVARIWFGPDTIKRQIDQFAALKFNVLHLHLTDDQGWRIQIDSWPRLTEHGGSTGAFGSPGGFLTKDDYRDLVRYAADRNITVVPEVGMPGHTQAALSSYPQELTCDGQDPGIYLGYEVGISTLCAGRPEVDRFVRDVVREVAEMTPGPYLHLGGDEAPTPQAEYDPFVRQVQDEVRANGKQMIGWAETLTGTDPAQSIGQYWFPVPDHAATTDAVARGAKIIASPGDHTYLDHRYTATDPDYGQAWAGPVELRQSYDWDPDTTVDGVSGPAVLGVEAPLFTQFIADEEKMQYLLFPRAAAVAETGWTAQQDRNWDGFRNRMVEQGQRWERDGVTFYRSPQIGWPRP